MLRRRGLLFGYTGSNKFDFPDIALDSRNTMLIYGVYQS
jgi:hypothetical protein